MMTDQPAPVTAADICALLAGLEALPRFAPLADRLAFHEHKAELLTRIAAMAGTPDAHAAAAEARAYCQQLARQHNAEAEKS
jgi:hypothetical protein